MGHLFTANCYILPQVEKFHPAIWELLYIWHLKIWHQREYWGQHIVHYLNIRLKNCIVAMLFLHFFKNYFLAGEWLLYNIVLASALQQRESATSMCAPSMLNFPPASTPSQPSRSSRSTGWSPCGERQLPTRSLLYTWSCTYVNAILSVSLPAVSKVYSLCLSLYSYLPCRWVHQYHLPRFHIYAMLIWILFFSFWLMSLWITGSRFIHLMRTGSDVFLSMAE